MSGDKEIEDQMAEESFDEFEEAGEEFADDFESEEEFFEDEALEGEEFAGDEDWESYDEDFSEEDGGQNTKKKSGSKSNNMIIAGAVVVGAFVMLWKMGMFSGGGQPPAPAAQQQVPQQQAQQQASPAQPAIITERDVISGRAFQPQETEEKTVEEDEPQGMMHNMDRLKEVQKKAQDAFYDEDSFYYEDDEPIDLGGAEAESDEIELIIDEPPMPSSISGEDEPLTPLLESDGSEDMADMDDSDFMPRGPDLDSEDMDIEIPEAQDVMKAAPAESDGFESESKDSAMGGSALAQINDKLDMIYDRLNSVELEIDSLKDRDESGIEKTQFDELKKSISALEKKVSNIESKPRTAAKTTSSSSSSRSYTTTKASPRWILKAAQPGTAWVSKSGESDMTSVSVGDSLAGIGKITAVEYMNGQWVVQGTKGKITQ
jgi:intracellular multiplication protein IcmG